MVIRDLSHPEVTPHRLSQTSPENIPVAPVSDRFIALILDFLILSPVVSFCVSGQLRDLKTALIVNSDSESITVLYFFFVAGMVLLSSLLQALFLYFWGATPGQKFMKLQVVPYPTRTDDRLSFAQCLVRALGWWVSVAFLCVPFLEILGHPLRRAFHERLTDTLVLSLKTEVPDRPLALEARYIGTTIWVCFGFLSMVGLSYLAKSYRGALVESLTPGKSYSQASCPQVPTEAYQDGKRLDLALALYIAELAEDTCVYSEAQKALWGADGEDKALAQVAMALITPDEKDSKKYYEGACQSSEKSEACMLSHYVLSDQSDRAHILRRAGLGLITSRVLFIKDSIETKNFVGAATVAQEMDKETPLKIFLERANMTVAWNLNEKFKNKTSSREPASSEERTILDQFKKKYNLP